MHLFRCLGEHRPWWLKAEWGGGLGNQRWVGPEPGTSSESLGDFRARASRCKEAVAEAEALSARRGSLPTPEDVLVLKDGFSRTLAVPDRCISFSSDLRWEVPCSYLGVLGAAK